MPFRSGLAWPAQRLAGRIGVEGFRALTWMWPCTCRAVVCRTTKEGRQEGFKEMPLRNIPTPSVGVRPMGSKVGGSSVRKWGFRLGVRKARKARKGSVSRPQTKQTTGQEGPTISCRIISRLANSPVRSPVVIDSRNKLSPGFEAR